MKIRLDINWFEKFGTNGILRMDDLEHVRKSSSSTSDAVLQLIQTLNAAVVYSEPTNFQTNVKLWNQYAKDWFAIP